MTNALQSEFDINNYLGKSIDEFDIELRNDYSKGSSYLVSKKKLKLYKNEIRNVVLRTEGSKKITHVTIFFPKLLDSNFHQKMLETYGLPDQILKKGSVLESKTNEVDEDSKSHSKTYATETTDFEDQPIIIIWSLSKLHISLMFNYEQETTKIIFSELKKT